MNIFYGKSASGRVSEAVSGLGTAKLIIMTSSADDFEENVQALEKLYPGVPSIACVGMGYDTAILENSMEISQKVKSRNTLCPEIPLL